MKKKISTKICIVGSGPAGSTTSLFLSKAGIDHVIIDKATFPRDKMCGEIMNGWTYSILRKLSPDYIQDLRSQDIINESWNDSWNYKGDYLRLRYNKKLNPRILSKRTEFDTFLFNKVVESKYAAVYQGEGVKKAFYHNGKAYVESDNYSIESELIVLANGATNSFFSDQWKSKINKPSKDYITFRKYYEGVERPEETEYEMFNCGDDIMGAVAVCPLSKDRCNVSVIFSADQYKNQDLKKEDYYKAALTQIENYEERFKNAKEIVPLKGTKVRLKDYKSKYSGQGFLLAGASAICVNPITGTGVGNALRMGKLAADYILENKDNLSGDNKTYSRRLKKELRSVFILNDISVFLMNHLMSGGVLLRIILRSKFLKGLLHRPDFTENIANPSIYFKHLFQRKKA